MCGHFSKNVVALSSRLLQSIPKPCCNFVTAPSPSLEHNGPLKCAFKRRNSNKLRSLYSCRNDSISEILNLNIWGRSTRHHVWSWGWRPHASSFSLLFLPRYLFWLSHPICCCQKILYAEYIQIKVCFQYELKLQIGSIFLCCFPPL